MERLCSILVICFWASGVFASGNWISGKLTGYHPLFYPNKVFLFNASPQGELTFADSCLISDSGAFVIKAAPLKQSAIYVLVQKGGLPITLVLAPADRVTISTSAADFKDGKATIIGSLENQLYQKLEDVRLAMDAEMAKRDSLVKKYHLFDPKYATRTGLLRETYFKQLLEANRTIQKLAAVNPHLFVTQVLSGLYYYPLKQESKQTDTAYDTHMSFWHHHYFDKVNFNDARIANSKLLFDKITYYFKAYVDASTFNGLKEGADILLKQVGNNTVREAIALYLIGYFNEKNDHEMTEYLFNEYYKGDGCETGTNTDVAALIQRLKAVAVGSVAPDIDLPDAVNQSKKLTEVKGSKATVLMFWASWCPHCTEAMPDVKTLYETYSDKGVQIYAVSLDYTREEWLRYLNSRPMNWINVAEGKGTKTETVKIYGVHGTPTFFLLDANLRIIMRTNELKDLEQKIRELP